MLVSFVIVDISSCFVILFFFLCNFKSWVFMALYLRVSEAGQETVISALTLFDGRNSIQLEKNLLYLPPWSFAYYLVS